MKFGYTDTVVLHDNAFNGITRIEKPQEGVGWPSKPDVAAPPPPCPTTFCFGTSFTVLFAANQQKESVGRAKVEETLRAYL